MERWQRLMAASAICPPACGPSNAGTSHATAPERVLIQGGLTPVAEARTRPGARNRVVTENGTAYLTDAPDGKVLVVETAATH